MPALTARRTPASRFPVQSTYSISAAQSQFPAVVRAAQSGRVIGVTKHDQTVAFVISRDRLEGLIETKELLANPKFVKALKEAKAGKGKYHPASALAD